MAEQAQKAIEEFPTTERDIQSLTIGISKESYRSIKQEMQEFLSRVGGSSMTTKAPHGYNLNVHLFPMSVPQPGKETRYE